MRFQIFELAGLFVSIWVNTTILSAISNPSFASRYGDVEDTHVSPELQHPATGQYYLSIRPYFRKMMAYSSTRMHRQGKTALVAAFDISVLELG
ncbi:hypothetical protein BC936DRAFT_148161 [Jimgerdemannia flammicorona]|uniref:Uncharacterized protein n=1 Tax=Jimgerdemannia flammicorona TaxID=994334 RepID=A0A433D3N9_9FUNG|nr:hypothetical protein BC936DRAFT_148161 [Jimgerdemannia flammicorona]